MKTNLPVTHVSHEVAPAMEALIQNQSPALY